MIPHKETMWKIYEDFIKRSDLEEILDFLETVSETGKAKR